MFHDLREAKQEARRAMARVKFQRLVKVYVAHIEVDRVASIELRKVVRAMQERRAREQRDGKGVEERRGGACIASSQT